VQARSGAEDLVRLLLESGARPQPGGGFNTPLSMASVLGRRSVMTLLLNHGIDPNENEGENLQHALARRSLESANVLIDVGAKVDFVGGPLGSPLGAAAMGGYLPLKYLIEKQCADYTLTDGDGRSALHIAARNTDVEAVEYLLRLGLDVNKKDAKGWSAIHYAALSDVPAILSLLLPLMSRDALTQSEGCSPLHLACRRNQPEALELLFQAGFRPYTLYGPDPQREWDLYAIAVAHKNRSLVSEEGEALHHLLDQPLSGHEDLPRFHALNIYCNGCLHGYVCLRPNLSCLGNSLIGSSMVVYQV
jgi:ankyrin repeat protein